jgi:hypothetical protein
LEQFINLVSGSDLAVGDGLQSHKNAVRTPGAFNLDGLRAVLIDTPGFDDIKRSGTDVLETITTSLETLYVALRLGLQNNRDCGFLTRHAPYVDTNELSPLPESFTYTEYPIPG